MSNHTRGECPIASRAPSPSPTSRPSLCGSARHRRAENSGAADERGSAISRRSSCCLQARNTPAQCCSRSDLEQAEMFVKGTYGVGSHMRRLAWSPLRVACAGIRCGWMRESDRAQHHPGGCRRPGVLVKNAIGLTPRLRGHPDRQPPAWHPRAAPRRCPRARCAPILARSRDLRRSAPAPPSGRRGGG